MQDNLASPGVYQAMKCDLVGTAGANALSFSGSTSLQERLCIAAGFHVLNVGLSPQGALYDPDNDIACTAFQSP